jgi:hypothetical protein
MGFKSLVKLLFDLVIVKARQQIDSMENRKLLMNTMLEFMGNFSMLAAPFPVRFQSAQPIVTVKNESIRKPTKILFIIAISPFIEIFL